MLTEEQQKSFDSINNALQRLTESCKLVAHLFKNATKPMSDLSEAIRSNPSLMKVCEASNMVRRLRKSSRH